MITRKKIEERKRSIALLSYRQVNEVQRLDTKALDTFQKNPKMAIYPQNSIYICRNKLRASLLGNLLFPKTDLKKVGIFTPKAKSKWIKCNIIIPNLND